MAKDLGFEVTSTSAEPAGSSLVTVRGGASVVLGVLMCPHGWSDCVFGLSGSSSKVSSSVSCRSARGSLMMFCNEAAIPAFSGSDSDSYDITRGVSWVSRDSRSISIVPRA